MNKNKAVALVIIDTDKITCDSRLLVGVRRPESNPQHPNVVSVPTQRVPDELFSAIEARIGLPAPPSSAARPGSNPVTYAVQSVLSHKLGLSDSLELERLQFAATARATFEGITPILSESDIAEPWKMIIIEVHITRWRDVHGSSASYTDLEWLRVGDFLDDLESGKIGSHIVGGLCIESTAKWLKSVLDKESLL